MSKAVSASLERALYDPQQVLRDPEFRILEAGEWPSKDVNLACFYNDKCEIHLVEKPLPSVAPGQVMVHVKSTGAPSCRRRRRLLISQASAAPTSTFGRQRMAFLSL